MNHATDDLVLAAGYNNGVGSDVRISTDNGMNWANWTPGKFKAPLFIFATHMSNATHGAIGGLNILRPNMAQTSDGGKTWHAVKNEAKLGGFIRHIGHVTDNTDMVIAVGDGDGEYGIRVSQDAGETWGSWISWQEPAGTTALTGSFPSENTWYVAGGHIPDAKAKKGSKMVFSRQTAIEEYISAKQGWSVDKKGNLYFDPAPVTDDLTKYYASIMKTTDGGKTWTQVYKSDQKLLGNMDCTDENNCWATTAGYGPNSDNIGEIIHTSDGGKTWEQQFSVPAGRKIVMSAINMVTATEGWAAYGAAMPGDKGVNGQFLHTNDAGKTWAMDANITGLIPTMCSFSSPNSGWCPTLPAQALVKANYLYWGKQ